MDFSRDMILRIEYCSMFAFFICLSEQVSSGLIWFQLYC